MLSVAIIIGPMLMLLLYLATVSSVQWTTGEYPYVLAMVMSNGLLMMCEINENGAKIKAHQNLQATCCKYTIVTINCSFLGTCTKKTNAIVRSH